MVPGIAWLCGHLLSKGLSLLRMSVFASIEMSTGGARLLVVEKPSKPGTPLLVLGRLFVPFPEAMTPAEKAEKLKASLAPLVGTSPVSVGMILSRARTHCRKALLPSSDPQELASMARFEAERNLPLNAERHIVEHAILGKPAVEGTEVLLAAVDEPVALEIVELAEAFGVTVESLGISTLALYRAWFSAMEKQGQNTQGPALLIHLGQESADLVLISKGQPVYNRSAPVGLQRLIHEIQAAGSKPFSLERLAELSALEPYRYFAVPGTEPDPAGQSQDPQAAAATGWFRRLLREIRQTVDFARRETATVAPEVLYISGAGIAIQDLKEFLGSNSGITVQIWDPWASIVPSPKLSESITVQQKSEDAVVVGALPFQSAAPYPNLVPAKYLAKRRDEQQKRSAVIIAIQVAAIVVLAVLLVFQRLQFMTQSTEALRELNASLATEAADLEAKQTRNQIVRNYIRGNSGPVEILDLISQFDIIPERVTLTRFEYKKDEFVKLSGHALNIQGVNAMESALRQMGIFSRVSQDQGSNAPTTLPNRGRDGTVLQWSMTCEFERPTARNARNRTTGQVITQ